MILQSLYEYYNRLRDDPLIDIPLRGFSVVKANIVVKISYDGELLELYKLGDAKKKFKEVHVPEQRKRSSGIFPYFLSDNFKYVFGWDFDPKKNKKMDKYYKAFVEYNQMILSSVNSVSSRAMLNYLDRWNCSTVLEHPVLERHMEDLRKLKSGNVVFIVEGEDNFIHDDPDIKEAWISYFNASLKGSKKAQCLVTGAEMYIEKIHPNIKGVRGANSTGATLVGFNADSFNSYNKKQGDNAPVSKEVVFAYTTALNYMLNSDAETHRIQLGDATTAFWAEDTSGDCETLLKSLINPEADKEDNKDKTLFVKNSLKMLKAGKPIIDKTDVRFYILGLSPNNSRLFVRFWYNSTFGQVVEQIRKHYTDCSIIKHPEEERLPTIYRILYETVPKENRNKDTSPALSMGIMQSVFKGSPYPYALYSTILNRIRIDGKVNHIRSGFIKGFLIRNARKYNDTDGEEIVTMALNVGETNAGYRLGRLFAVLEKIQLDVQKKINTTIKDMYFGTASVSPSYVFPVLIKLSQHHLPKYASSYRKNYMERLIQEILEMVPELPAHLNTEDQGRFMLGYYHQRTDLYTKKSKEENDGE